MTKQQPKQRPDQYRTETEPVKNIQTNRSNQLQPEWIETRQDKDWTRTKQWPNNDQKNNQTNTNQLQHQIRPNNDCSLDKVSCHRIENVKEFCLGQVDVEQIQSLECL